jgi:hypothetical protein
MPAPLIKRLPTKVSYRDDILLYGPDNLYPQRVEEVVLSSPITKSAIQVTSDFLNGEGFELNGETLLGDYSANELLNRSTPDFSLYSGMALILDTNMDGEIVEVVPVDFKYVRLGAPDKNGKINTVKVSVDWEEQLPSAIRPKTLTYALWVSKDHAKAVIDSWDFESQGEFPGFVYYFTPKKNQYPLSTVDAVLDSSQTNAEIQTFELAGVQNGFLGATILKHQGKIADNGERARLEGMVSSIKGAENANSVIIWEVPDGYDGEVLEQFPANNQDRLFEETNKTTVNRIVQALAIPPSLLGIMPENSFFSMQEIEDSYRYFNVRTRNRRTVIARIFNDIGKDFVTPVQFGNVKQQQFI